MKQAQNSLQLPKPQNTHKIANTCIIIGRCFWGIKLPSYHVLKVKSAMSAHTMADAVIKRKENTFYIE